MFFYTEVGYVIFQFFFDFQNCSSYAPQTVGIWQVAVKGRYFQLKTKIAKKAGISVLDG